MLLDDLPSKRDRISSGMGIDPVQYIDGGLAHILRRLFPFSSTTNRVGFIVSTGLRVKQFRTDTK